jgi:hypothetical protein
MPIPEKRKQLFGSIEESIAKEIEQEASMQDRSVNYLVGVLIKKGWIEYKRMNFAKAGVAARKVKR